VLITLFVNLYVNMLMIREHYNLSNNILCVDCSLILTPRLFISDRKTAEITSSGGHTLCIDMRHCNNQANVDPAIAMMIIEEGGGWVAQDEEVFAVPNDARIGTRNDHSLTSSECI